jgi:spore coat protein CotH
MLVSTSAALRLTVILCAAGLAAPAATLATPPEGVTVVLNEINCEATDWVELVNASEASIDVTGWLLTDDPLDASPARPDHRYIFPAGTIIAPGAMLVIERVAGGLPFGISCGGDTIRLADGAAGSLVDAFAVPVLAASGDTWGRYPDGTGTWVETAPTKGSVNEPSSAGGGTPPDPSWLFDPAAVHVIELALPQATIDALNARSTPTEDYYDATFSVVRADGQAYGPLAVGVRLKGGTFGFRSLAGKAAFKIKFNHAVAGQRFQGLKRLTLNSMVQDDSMVHETLAYAAFRAAGVPAPRTGYAYVRVNGEDYGVYLDVETLDDVALQSRFATTQHLYEGEYTADVLPGSSGDFEVDEGSATDRSDLDALIAAVNAEGPFSENVGPLADLAEMTRQWAVERYIGHWDSYSGWDDSAFGDLYSPNNYYLHSDAAGRFSMLPWGADQTWTKFPLPFGFDDGQAVMFTRCLTDPACAALYRDAVESAATSIEGLGLATLADSTAAMLRPWQELDPRRESTLDDIDAAIAGVHEFAAAQRLAVAIWLDTIAPSLAPTLNAAPILLGATVTATPNASDEGSGVAGESCDTPDTSTTGIHTLSCTATDNAGHSTTVSVPYLVEYRILGFFSPASNARWKRGQTIPIKVALGDVNGVRIPDAEAQALLSPTCRVSFVASGAQSKRECLRYDNANQQLTHTWRLGQATGAATISVEVAYPGTTTKTVLSQEITITR